MDEKKYKEALERAKAIYQDSYKPDTAATIAETLQSIFPELKEESEDERIRKWIIDTIKAVPNDSIEWETIDKSSVLAWLEKQESVGEIVERCKTSWYNEGKIDGMAEGLTNDEKYQQGWHDALEKQGDNNEIAKGILRGAAINLITWIDYNAAEGNMCLSNMECKDIEDALVSGDWDKIYAYIKKKLEKQGEQKPILDFKAKDWYVSKVDGKIHNIYHSVDKVEPKFKVGDWVVYYRNDSSREIIQVYDIRDGRYYFTNNVHFSWSIKECDEKSHLWTIQDAKDGDVVVDKSIGDIGIFESIGNHPDGGSCNDPSYCYLHCRYDDGFFYADFEDGNTIDSDDLIPATKAQRALLFKKMHEAGYEWDAEKKEVKLLITNGGDFDTENCEQNPAWSEEDDYNLQCMIAKVTSDIQKGNVGRNNELIDWLKSLKERIAQCRK